MFSLDSAGWCDPADCMTEGRVAFFGKTIFVVSGSKRTHNISFAEFRTCVTTYTKI